MSLKWQTWLAASTLFVIGAQIHGWSATLALLGGLIVMYWPLLAKWSGRKSPLDNWSSGRADWLAWRLGIVLVLGAAWLFFFVPPEQNKRAHNLAWALQMSGLSLSLFWARLGKRQES